MDVGVEHFIKEVAGLLSLTCWRIAVRQVVCHCFLLAVVVVVVADIKRANQEHWHPVDSEIERQFGVCFGNATGGS